MTIHNTDSNRWVLRMALRTLPMTSKSAMHEDLPETALEGPSIRATLEQYCADT